ncbi:MAG: ATPase, T2SS/T4P/T4SS family [Limisphaerales bacterium]
MTTTIPSMDKLNLPEVFNEIPREKTGLVLITGATGSGKSTTLAANSSCHQQDQGRSHRHSGRPG